MTCRVTCQYIDTRHGVMCWMCGMNPAVAGPPPPPKELVGLAGLINTPHLSEIRSDFWQDSINSESKPLTFDDIKKVWEKSTRDSYEIRPRVYPCSQAQFDALLKAGMIKPNGEFIPFSQRTSSEAAIEADNNQGEQHE